MSSRVLIVEDEQIIAEDLAIQVRRLGYDVQGIAISGAEAIAMAEETRPELVLMDIQLEGLMAGTEAAKIIRERTGATIVFMTAFPSAFLQADPPPRENHIWVTKPFSRFQLEAALKDASTRRQA